MFFFLPNHHVACFETLATLWRSLCLGVMRSPEISSGRKQFVLLLWGLNPTPQTELHFTSFSPSAATRPRHGRGDDSHVTLLNRTSPSEALWDALRLVSSLRAGHSLTVHVEKAYKLTNFQVHHSILTKFLYIFSITVEKWVKFLVFHVWLRGIFELHIQHWQIFNVQHYVCQKIIRKIKTRPSSKIK